MPFFCLENEVVVRQLKALKNKRAAAANAKLAKKVAKQLDETQMKEVITTTVCRENHTCRE